MIGFISINKISGDTSAYCVNKVKKKLNKKCGHMGTLDPLASGVLPIGIGQATRLFDTMLDKIKVYKATFDFAYSTPSLDLETEANAFSDYIPNTHDILQVIPSLTGEINQIPPSFSAKFVDGKRSYKLARKGVAIDLPPKTVSIYSITLLNQISKSAFDFEITCGGGTYIRSIARDMAKLLSCQGVMTNLVRIKSGCFDLKNSVTLEEFLSDDSPEKFIIPPQNVIDYDTLTLTKLQAKRLLDGLYDNYSVKDGFYKIFCSEDFLGIGYINKGILKMKTYIRDL